MVRLDCRSRSELGLDLGEALVGMGVGAQSRDRLRWVMHCDRDSCEQQNAKRDWQEGLSWHCGLRIETMDRLIEAGNEQVQEPRLSVCVQHFFGFWPRW